MEPVVTALVVIALVLGIFILLWVDISVLPWGSLKGLKNQEGCVKGAFSFLSLALKTVGLRTPWYKAFFWESLG